MDKLSILGKEFSVQTFANAVPTACEFIKRSFNDTLLFSIMYDLSGVDPNKELDELTDKELAKVVALRAKTPRITAKDNGLRPFILKSFNKGADTPISLNDFNNKLFKEGTFDANGSRSEEENTIFDKYCKAFSARMLKGSRDVYCVDIPVSDLTDGKIKMWKPEYTDKPVPNIIAYDINPDTLPQTTMSAIARFFATVDDNTEEEEEE